MNAFTPHELRTEADKIDGSEYYADLYGGDERDRYVFALRLAASSLEVQVPDDRPQMARTMGSLLALTESMLNGDKYEGENGQRARALVVKVKTTLARSRALAAGQRQNEG